eukprot:6477087-Amphidinium_carterae.1
MLAEPLHTCKPRPRFKAIDVISMGEATQAEANIRDSHTHMSSVDVGGVGETTTTLPVQVL